VDAAQEVIVEEHDCGTLKGINVTAIVENGEIVEPFIDRVVGRMSLERIVHPDTNKVIVDMNEEITEAIAHELQNLGIEKVKLRSVLTCEAKRGVCQLCYGRNMSSGFLVELGEAVGIIGAQSIGEPGTQLTMRTFHVGGIAMRGAERSKLETKNDGLIRFNNVKAVVNKEKSLIIVNRNANIAIMDYRGREIEHYQVPYGAKLLHKEGDAVKARQIFAEWDPFNTFILTEETGRIQFQDVVPKVSMEEEQDEITGLMSPVIIEPKDEKLQPRIEIVDLHKKEKMKDSRTGKEKEAPLILKRYYLPSGAHLEVKNGNIVHAGDALAKIPREVSRTKDITGGLPRAEELFEARRPKTPAVISEIDGTVEFGGLVRGYRKLTVKSDRIAPKEYLIPKGAHISVGDGERLKAGTPLMDGPVNPHDILKVLGEKELAEYLLREVQEVYRLQGVAINDKHIEVIIRQMLRWVKVEEVGDTEFLVDEQVDKFVFQEENLKVIKKGGKPAKARPLLLGITKSALSTDSFIAAASFQETTRVLTEASIYGKVDQLRSLKENIIMGRLIPAGTGYKFYRDVELREEKAAETEKAAEEAPPQN
jgi:DNA-directed RNA polymerase subunit beta'